MLLILIVTSEKNVHHISINYFSSAQKIEFRDIKNLSRILFTRSVKPHQPCILCAVSPTVLVYADNSTPKENHLHWLDCSKAEPKLLGITANTNIGIIDMCLAEYENEMLLIALPYNENESIYVCNSATGQLKWTAEKKVPSTGKNVPLPWDNDRQFW